MVFLRRVLVLLNLGWVVMLQMCIFGFSSIILIFWHPSVCDSKISNKKLKLFGFLFSIDIAVSIKSLLTETINSSDDKRPNNLSFSV